MIASVLSREGPVMAELSQQFRFGLRTLIAFVTASAVISGWYAMRERSVEQTLNLQYPSPRAPANLATAYQPGPKDWANCLLRPGKSTVDFKQEYIEHHKLGWKMAIEDWDDARRFQYNLREDFNVWQNVPSSVDALWEGYNAAREQILAKINTVSR